MTRNNPFQFEAANNLSAEMVADFFVDDFNYSRFLQSRRNVFLVGERGSGKTMALLYNSSRIQKLIATRKDKQSSSEVIGIYVPCNTPLTYKPEFELLGKFLAGILSEHLFVLSIAHAIVTTLSDYPSALADVDQARLRSEASTILATDLSTETPFFDSIRLFLEGQIRDTQRTALSRELGEYHEDTFSFASLVMPLLGLFSRNIPALKESHYSLLIDDAHALNKYQRRALNSWVAFRDHSLFSFKIATTQVALNAGRPDPGGSILEGHDYTRIDLERPLHNPRTGFYKLAEQIITRRLRKIGIEASPQQFFPVHEQMRNDLARAEAKVEEIAVEKYGAEKKKAITDYVYKYARAHYFRERDPKANRPAYSGFETLVYISTGVVRNLLEPCYWMYEQARSTANSEESDVLVTVIDPSIQRQVILEKSEQAWRRLKEQLPSDIEDCSNEQGTQAYQLFDALAVHLRQRLLGPGSEPNATSFTISKRDSDAMQRLAPLLRILQAAQMLYVRSGPSKDEGRREEYYVPNRILWPIRGLDPHGQHARVSLPSDELWAAAQSGKLPVPRWLSGKEAGAGTRQADLLADE
ncbi:hypothetical protein F4212_05460 [Candidatus Poribacteria bacterium]|nr:hypothetical protein [Gammaproteobacteria bacterium]MYF98571.1 hypothetical protein [Candidatus Poribacteria bacterium]